MGVTSHLQVLGWSSKNSATMLWAVCFGSTLLEGPANIFGLIWSLSVRSKQRTLRHYHGKWSYHVCRHLGEGVHPQTCQPAQRIKDNAKASELNVEFRHLPPMTSALRSLIVERHRSSAAEGRQEILESLALQGPTTENQPRNPAFTKPRTKRSVAPWNCQSTWKPRGPKGNEKVFQPSIYRC